MDYYQATWLNPLFIICLQEHCDHLLATIQFYFAFFRYAFYFRTDCVCVFNPHSIPTGWGFPAQLRAVPGRDNTYSVVSVRKLEDSTLLYFLCAD